MPKIMNDSPSRTAKALPVLEEAAYNDLHDPPDCCNDLHDPLNRCMPLLLHDLHEKALQQANFSNLTIMTS